jgi:UDPglucose 6-dehydrogenase
MRVAVVGTGRVGLPFAAVASLHFPTTAIDANAELVARINSKSHFDEPGLDECLQKGSLSATTEVAKVHSADLVIVCVGSQDGERGYSAARPLEAMRAIAPDLQGSNQILCMMSTLPPSSISRDIVPFYRSSGLEARIRGFAYTPAMIALGEAVRNFQSPNYVMIGANAADVSDEVAGFWKAIAGPQLPIVRSTVENIAVAKYALNLALVLKISLMNLTAEFCEHFDGDVDVVADIFRMDPRLAGGQMFRGGLGYGGTCFPVDVAAFITESEQVGMPSNFLHATQILNDWQIQRSVEQVATLGVRRVSLLGTAFKPNTNVVVNSQGLEIARRLAERGLEVTVYDPVAIPSTREVLGTTVRYAANVSEALASAEAVFIAVDWAAFRDLPPNSFRPDQIVIDPWRVLRNSPPVSRYMGYGLPAQ